jgi:hypothetical protein
VVIPQDLVGRPNLISCQIGDVEYNVPMNELPELGRWVGIGNYNPYIYVGSRGKDCPMGEPVRRTGAEGSTEARYLTGFLNDSLTSHIFGIFDDHDRAWTSPRKPDTTAAFNSTRQVSRN